MKYLIPIDRSSIKPNEHYPHLGTYIIYPIEYRKIETFTYIAYNSPINWKLESSQVSVEEVDHKEYVDALGKPPKYFYSYADTMVQCNCCLKKFNYGELESDRSDDLSDGTDTQCPFCKKWDCCEIEYERLSEDILEGLCLQHAK